MKRVWALWPLLALLAPQTTRATCTQDFLYRGDGVEVAIMENFGSERPLLEIITEGGRAVAMVRGWKREHTRNTPIHRFGFACGQLDYASFTLGKEEQLERSCITRSAATTLAEMLPALGWSGQAVDRMPGFTIQLAYLPAGIDSTSELDRWEDRLLVVNVHQLPVTISVEGDCIQQSIWLHHYPWGGTGVRFGIFQHYRDALRAIKLLQLPANHAQILPQTFRLDRLGEYIRH